MTVTLCIDPGIRNLAMCIMNNDFNILLWDVFNVLDSDDYHCNSNTKIGKVCNKKCSMKYKSTNEIIYTCKTHFPKNVSKTKQNEFKKKNINEYLLQDIALTFITRIQEVYNDHTDIFKSLTCINIELQPKCNAKMVFISHILYGKLVELFQDTIPIRYVRASQKLKAYTGPEIKCTLKGAYAKRKYLAIEYGRWFLDNKFSKNQRDIWSPTLVGKLDDKFDVLLMSINAITGISKKQLKHLNGNELK